MHVQDVTIGTWTSPRLRLSRLNSQFTLLFLSWISINAQYAMRLPQGSMLWCAPCLDRGGRRAHWLLSNRL